MFILQDRDFEQKAYPDLFPTGSGGYNPNESNGLSLRRYFQQRLCNVDGRFAKMLNTYLQHNIS